MNLIVIKKNKIAHKEKLKSTITASLAREVKNKSKSKNKINTFDLRTTKLIIKQFKKPMVIMDSIKGI
jgi:hypothetical protein